MTPAPVTRITGRTRLFAVLGDPVAQVRAPSLLNPEFERRGIDAVLVPVHAPVAKLAEVVRGLQAVANLDGLLVTVPHKIAVCGLADLVGPAAELAGSANALRRDPDGRWYAENFDGAGFVAGLVHSGHIPAGRRVALVGAGGAGSAIAIALLQAGVAELRVVDPDPSRLDALRAGVAVKWPDAVTFGAEPDLLDIDLLVNATPLGLRPDDPLPVALDGLPRTAVVADIIMEPRMTPLLARAESAGHPVHHGIHMLTHQVPAYLEFFRLV